ncbi:MAG: cytochrome c3 family protein [Desulfobacteraceae bacterium]
MQVKTVVIIFLVCLFTAAASFVVAAEKKGAEKMELNGGSRGMISFPHSLHQNALEECTVCHSIFPMEKGSIDRLKAEGTLKKKQVMYRSCIQCHRDKKKAGESYGPTSCSQCHAR